jgi:hypothetical protein
MVFRRSAIPFTHRGVFWPESSHSLRTTTSSGVPKDFRNSMRRRISIFSSAGLSAQRQTQMHMSCHFPAYRGKSHQTIAHRLKAVLPHLYLKYSGRRFQTLVAALSCLQEQSQTTQPSSRKIRTKDARSSTRLFNTVATIGGRCL